MTRQLTQPTTVPDVTTQSYLRQLVRDLELRFQSTEQATYVMFGHYNYDDLATKTTPISVVGGAGWVKLTNDALGPSTVRDWAIPGLPDIWESGSLNHFDFSPLPLGSTVDIRLDLIVTTTTPNTAIAVKLDLGVGDPSTYSIPILSDRVFKSAATYQLGEYNSIFIGNGLTQQNPAELKIRADNNINVVVNGWYVRVLKNR